MKKANLILSVLILFSSLFYQACKKKDDTEPDDKSILPSSFRVDIPDAISQAAKKKSTKSTASDTLQGNDIYEHLTTFIYVGDEASKIVGEIIYAVLGLVGVVFLVLVILAGLKWMTAGGNEEKVAQAKKSLWDAAIGVLIVLGAYAITAFIFTALL